MIEFVKTIFLDFWNTVTEMSPYLLFGFFVAGVISIFLGNLLNKQPLEIFGDGYDTRDYIYVKDTADICIKVMESKFDNSCVVSIPATAPFRWSNDNSLKMNLQMLKNQLGQMAVVAEYKVGLNPWVKIDQFCVGVRCGL